MNIYGVDNNPQKPEGAALKSDKKKSKEFLKGRKLMMSIIGGGVLLILLFIIYAIADAPPFNEIENPQSDLSTMIYSEDGKELGTLFSDENRISVKLSDISKHAVDALIATEDIRFYQHSGIDAQSIPALIVSFLEGDPRGGSTITMQLARNLFDKVGRKRTPIRKLKEYIVATYIERSFTKEEILTAYFNTVNIYGADFGIETASARLFGKKAKDINLEEAALLVGMLKGQGVFNPVKFPERSKDRRNTVLDQMVKYGFLKPVVADSVKKLPLKLSQGTGYSHDTGPAPYFREYLRNYLKEWCKKNGYDAYSDGLRIYTTLDSRMQEYGEEAVKEHMTSLQKVFDGHVKGREAYKRADILKGMIEKTERYKNGKKAGKSQAEIDKEFQTPVKMVLFSWNPDAIKDTTLTPMDSLKYFSRFLECGFVAIDPATGHVKTWVGGNNYKFFKYDHVGLGKRQVGSTFKPFVYAAAIDNGKLPCDVELNQPICFSTPSGKWCPKNADGSVGGYMTLRRALGGSVNLVTARLMKEFGPKLVANYAYQLGVESKLDEVPALCLGTTDLSVLELVGAYTTFANKGIHIKPLIITRIEDRNGKVVEEFMPQSNTALSEDKAYLMIDILKGVVDEQFGTANRLRFRYNFKNEIAGKTGTTQDNTDGWFVGMTPNLVSGCWVGCAEREMRFHSTGLGQGANTALPIWALFMKKVYADKSIGLPQDPFQKPQSWDPRCIPYQDASSVLNNSGGGSSVPPTVRDSGSAPVAPSPNPNPPTKSTEPKVPPKKTGSLNDKDWE